MYGRSGCHPCDDAKALLRARQVRWGFRLEERDIDADPAWAAEYGECVPVVVIDGKVRFRGRVDARLLDRLLG